MLRSLTGALLVGLALVAQAAAAPYTGDFPWREWSDQVFEQAAREKKFVLLSLQSWWCPWCHVMNRDTYDDPGVRKYLLEHFIPVRVDQDSRPDISQRYERWGWPATIIFGPDGTEIVKLRGFYSPQFFMPVLVETVKDPSPVDYGTRGGPERARTLARSLTEAQRAEIRAFIDQSYDAVNGGWGKSKLVDAPTLTWALDRAKDGDRAITPQIRKTMERLPDLVHAGTGAVSQVSLKPDWSAPAPEFPMFAQEAALKAFAQAYALWGDPRFKTAGAKVARFLTGTMAAPDGGFYASLGLGEGNPGVDRRQYARENGQAIAGLLAWYDATGDEAALRAALRASDWVLANRARPGGGFRHADKDAAGPYLADNVEMGKALLALHRSTGDRRWLAEARATADFIAADLRRRRHGRLHRRRLAGCQAPGEAGQAARGQCDGRALLQPAALLYGRGEVPRDRRGGHGVSRPLRRSWRRTGSCPTCCRRRPRCCRSRSTSPWSAPRTIRGRRRWCAPASPIRCSTSASSGGTSARGRCPITT